MSLKAGLYLVATPIGNLEDITLRALNVLKNSDIIFCEDSRISQKLLAKHNIVCKLQLYNDHSNSHTRNLIITYVQQGKIISLISDAGSPLISDPGYKLVHDLRKANCHVDVIPGACSVIAALSVCGLPTDRFLFNGFAPKTKEGKIKLFQELMSIKTTLIFFESANRLVDTLKIAYETFGEREASVVRELTKLYQEVNTSLLSELVQHYHLRPAKGEIIILIAKAQKKDEITSTEQIIINKLNKLLKYDVSVKSSVEILADELGGIWPKKAIYKLANRLKIT